MPKRPYQNMWQHLITLSKGLDESLQLQLRKALTNLILEHRISLDTPLPSSRDLARMLNVSRSTVTLAYQRLVDEGYLLSRERQGYFVNPKMTNTLPFKETMTTDQPAPRIDWGRRLKYKLTAQRNISKPIDWYHYAYPFIFGQVDAELMPLTEWRECWRQSQGARSITRGGYDLLDQDDASLIEQLLRRVLPGRGIWCYAENILVTLGAQNALSMIIKLLIKADTVVGFENPGYPDARHLFELETNNLRLLEVDDEGLIISDEINACDYLYLTPAFQSPTTATLSPMRRKQLFKKAKEHNIIIIEDDYESEAAFGDQPIPSLKSQDENNCVIYCGSLSKSLAPGLRIGFLMADQELIKEARALRRLTIRHPPPLIEKAVALFIELGHYDSHLNRMSRVYRERWSTMAAALDNWLPQSKMRQSFGGTSFWYIGDPSLDADQLAIQARAEGILIEPGSVYFGEADPKRNCFRLGFSAIANDKIEPGIKNLAKLFQNNSRIN